MSAIAACKHFFLQGVRRGTFLVLSVQEGSCLVSRLFDISWKQLLESAAETAWGGEGLGFGGTFLMEGWQNKSENHKNKNKNKISFLMEIGSVETRIRVTRTRKEQE